MQIFYMYLQILRFFISCIITWYMGDLPHVSWKAECRELLLCISSLKGRAYQSVSSCSCGSSPAGHHKECKTPAVCLAPSLSCPAVQSLCLAFRISCAYSFGDFFTNNYCHSNIALCDPSNNSCNSIRPVLPSPLFLTSPH